MENIRKLVGHELLNLIQDRVPLQSTVNFKDDLILLESGVDSLGFAILVTRLEMRLGYDPFTIDPNPVYPRTFGDFVSFYEKYSHLRMVE